MEPDRRQRSSVALTGSRSRAGGMRRAWQLALGALSWVGFALLWLWQLEVYVPATWLYSICLIGIILGLWIVFTIGWVSWNRNIYARRHRRTNPVRMEVGFEQDSLGRPIVASGGIRAAEGQIVISVDEGGAKRYEPAKRRLLPRLPSVRELLPDWDAIPVAAAAPAAAVPMTANGNGYAHHNGHAVVGVNGGAPHANGNGNGNGNGHGHDPEQVRGRVERMVAEEGAVAEAAARQVAAGEAAPARAAVAEAPG